MIDPEKNEEKNEEEKKRKKDDMKHANNKSAKLISKRLQCLQ